jgi:hypothetical protein
MRSSPRTLDGLLDPKCALVEVQIDPSEAQQFASAQAHGRGDHVQRVEPVWLRGAKQRLDLVEREALTDLVPGRRDLD